MTPTTVATAATNGGWFNTLTGTKRVSIVSISYVATGGNYDIIELQSNQLKELGSQYVAFNTLSDGTNNSFQYSGGNIDLGEYVLGSHIDLRLSGITGALLSCIIGLDITDV